MKKKILTLSLAACLAATAIIGGTMAYFTDSDVATNVMAVGNVQIVQNEQQRIIDAENDDLSHDVAQVTDDGLETFEDGKKLFPVTKDTATGYDTPVATMYKNYSNALDDVSWKNQSMFDTKYNVVDKIVTISNTGTEDAYVRTLLAFEIVYNEEGENVIDDYIMTVHNYNIDYIMNDAGDDAEIFTINGVDYCVGTVTYTDALKAGYTTAPSLKQFYLKNTAGNEFYSYVGDEYTILALSQAVQTEGFDDAATALNTAFGDPKTVENKTVVEWFANVPAALN